jgi:hypothetical protein
MSELILLQLQKSLISFFDEMIELFPKEPDFIKIRIYLKDQVEIQDVMDVFTYNITRTDMNNETVKKMIKERDDIAIMESPILTEYFTKDKINYYKKFWNSPHFVTDDKKMVWKWLDSFVGISERYNKLK